MTCKIEVRPCKENKVRVVKLDQEGNKKESSILEFSPEWPGVFYVWGGDKLLIEEIEESS